MAHQKEAMRISIQRSWKEQLSSTVLPLSMFATGRLAGLPWLIIETLVGAVLLVLGMQANET